MTNCKACALCCIFADSVAVRAHENVPEKLTYVDINGRRWMKLVGRTCIALNKKAMRCTIYDVRPDDCRHFEVDGVSCASLRSKQS